MKVSEFRACINEAERLLQDEEKTWGVCGTLYVAGRNILGRWIPLNHGFDDLFRPRNLEGYKITGINGLSGYWLGHIAKKNLKLRIHFLRSFEAYCLVHPNETYRKW